MSPPNDGDRENKMSTVRCTMLAVGPADGLGETSRVSYVTYRTLPFLLPFVGQVCQVAKKARESRKTVVSGLLMKPVSPFLLSYISLFRLSYNVSVHAHMHWLPI